jgi:anti-anti-sigma regulatory factor
MSEHFTLQGAGLDPNPKHGLTIDRTIGDHTAFRIIVTRPIGRDNAPQLRLLSDDAIDDGRLAITLDLAHCGYVDARGFGILIAIANRVNRKGGWVEIRDAKPDVRALFESHRIASFFQFEPGEHALQDIQRGVSESK